MVQQTHIITSSILFLKRWKYWQARISHGEEAEAFLLPKAEKFSRGVIFTNDDCSKFLREFIFTNGEYILSCFYSLNNKKMWVLCQKLNFTCIEIHKFAFVWPFALLYCRESGQHLRNSKNLSIYILLSRDTKLTCNI